MIHDVSAYHEPTGWGWSCRCGKRNKGMPGQRSEYAALASGRRHIRTEEDRARRAQ